MNEMNETVLDDVDLPLTCLLVHKIHHIPKRSLLHIIAYPLQRANATALVWMIIRSEAQLLHYQPPILGL